MIAGVFGSISTLLRFLAFLSFTFPKPSEDEVVRINTLKEIRRHMNESVDPCENFNEFVCGKYHKYSNFFEGMGTNFMSTIASLLHIHEPDVTELEQKLKDVFRSCNHEHQTAYEKNIKKLILEFGNMPALVGNSWQEENFDWQTTSALMQYKYGVFPILGFEVLADKRDISKHAIYIGNRYLQRKSTNIDYEVYSILDELVKMKLNFESISRTTSHLYNFEQSLTRGLPDGNKYILFKPTTIKELQSKYSPILNITHMIYTALGSMPNCTYYADHKYLENLVKVTLNSPKARLADYVFYKFLQNFKSGNCFSELLKIFPSVVETFFYRKNIKNQTLKDVNKLWLDIKTSFHNFLSSQDWMQSDVKKVLLEKLNHMEMQVPGSKENEDLQNLLRNYDFKNGDYIENIKTIRSLYARYERDKIYRTPRRALDPQHQNIFSPITVLLFNLVTVPVMYLQPTYMLSTSLPKYFNFARMGTTLAHEVAHGFDDIDRKYNKDGVLRNWWDKQTADVFGERVKCFVDQYDKLKYRGEKLPKRLERFEDLADNIGLRAAYQAYLSWYNNSARTAEELELEISSHSSFNNKQMFFISYAQMYCSSVSKIVLDSHKHTPTALRAQAALSNMPEFAEEFACPIGSAMNRIEKCRVY